MRKALITGITGQDGSYLAEYLVRLGYEVHGLVRHIAAPDQRTRFYRIQHLIDHLQVKLHYGSLEDFASVYEVVNTVKPDEVYHLGAQSFVSNSFDDEFSTKSINCDGTHYMLAACKRIVPRVKFYFAGSSEMFGKVISSPQDENTPFHPRSVYGASKAFGFDLARIYRERNDLRMHCSSGILFNHESPRRGIEFVTRKITHTAARIKFELADKLELGNPDAMRDWGFAGDYVEAMWLMLQQPKPDDYVIATGETHSVREFIEAVFGMLKLETDQYVTYSTPEFIRPAEVDLLVGNAGKARKVLDWKPRVKFDELVEMMVQADMQLIGDENKRNRK